MLCDHAGNWVRRAMKKNKSENLERRKEVLLDAMSLYLIPEFTDNNSG
jgi:hypothetical protein